MMTDVTEFCLQRGETFDEFFAERFAPLSRLAFLLTESAQVADELAQDACEQVFRRWRDIDHPRSYARMAVVNGARSWGRHRTVAERTPGDIPTPTDLDADAIAVRDVLERLPERQREVLVLRFYADLKLDDIAAELECPVGTVKSIIHRGLARMQEELS